MTDNFFSFKMKIDPFSSDLYRIQNNLPLQGESHSRYISSKAPIRKNKDFRARPRNYFAGFPIYKKDTYTRHFYNLLDIFNSDSPVVKYFKIGVVTYFSTLSSYFLYHSFVNKGEFGNVIDQRQLNYVGFSGYSKNLRILFKIGGKPSLLMSIFFTSMLFFRDYLEKNYHYDRNNSNLRTSFIAGPLAYLSFTGPHYGFMLGAFLSSIFLYYTLNLISICVYGHSPKTMLKAPTFYYLKGVSDEEKTVIELENEKLYNTLVHEDYYTKEKYGSQARNLI